MGTKIENRAYETDSIASDNSLSAPYILAISNKKGYLYILSEVSFMCGFANAQGGTLYIGLRDNGEVCNVHDAKKLMEEIPNKVRDMMGIMVDVNLKEKDKKAYLEIVTEAYPYPVSFRGKYYQRSGATNQELKGAALDRFMLRKQGKTWDGVPVPYLKEEDLDNATFDLFRKYAKRSGRMEDADLMDDNHGLLEKLRLYEAVT